jgi:tRNA(fMet)-specific endonuclease VapC
MPDYLLDTNHATRLLSGSEALSRRLGSVAATDATYGIPVTVLGELFYAAYASERRQENLEALHNFISDIIVWPFDQSAADEFGKIQAEQKAKGRPIPPTDAQIASVARLHELIVLTADRHFGYIGGLKVENWLE